ncbi:MAG: hypothetical protein ACREX4_25080 [Gammaproteobacteria bacterium]
MLHSLLEISLSQWKDIATVTGALVALITLMKGVIEFRRQGAQKRWDLFFSMHDRLKGNAKFGELCELLEQRDDEKLLSHPYQSKNDFLSFFEEVAMLTNSGLLRREVARYMFGYYAVRCWESDAFWQGINRDGPYWLLFRSFAQGMGNLEATKRAIKVAELRF